MPLSAICKTNYNIITKIVPTKALLAKSFKTSSDIPSGIYFGIEIILFASCSEVSEGSYIMFDSYEMKALGSSTRKFTLSRYGP